MIRSFASSKTQLALWADDLRLELRKAVKLAGSWQLDGVGLDGLGSEIAPGRLSQSGRRDLAHLIRASNLKTTVLRADVGGRRLLEPQQLDRNLECIRQVFELARDLNTTRVLVPLGFVAEKDSAQRRERAQLQDACSALLSFSAVSGICPVVPLGSEPPEVLLAFLDEVDPSGLIQVDWAPDALVGRGLNPLDLLGAACKRIALAHARDRYRGGGEAPFGSGDVQWGEVLVGLSTLAGREPPALVAGCGLEGDRVTALGLAVRKLKALQHQPFPR